MAKTKLDDASKWLTPRAALEIAQRCYGDAAGKIIMERLRGDLLPAIAARWSSVIERQEPEVSDEPTAIPASCWPALQDESVFWKAGDATFFFFDSIYPNRTVRCVGIRFLRKTIEDMFPAPAESAPKPESPETHSAAPKEPDTKGPPVSEAALAAWYEAYKKTFTGADDTEAKAMESARGCFPGRSFSRDAVRALRGSVKRGPKSAK